MRSLTYFTACLIFDLEKKIKFKIDKWILTGGGIKNKTLISDIHDLITKKKVNYPEKFGFDSDFIESQAFAFISIRTLKGLVSAFPETTGCEKSNVCGKIFVPNKN